MAKRSAQFQTIRTEGAILPPDILRRIASLKVDGATPEAYHLPPGTKINEAISQSWTSLLNHWRAFQEAREKTPESDETGTGVTNERWLLPLFKELDFGRLITTKAPQVDERVYPIERFYNHTPIHLVGCKLPLDRRTKGARGAATASPHSMVQEFLNCSDDHLWAFLSNGLQLRILRDNISLSRQAFVEFDLEAMMDGEVYADFALLWLLCHQSRVEADKPEDCWLEKWSKLAQEQGTRVLENLRIGVGKAIEALGRGFIGHPRNDHLREKLQTGTLSKDDYYRQLLRIVYRLLFLFVAEDRELLHPPLADEAEVANSEVGSRVSQSSSTGYSLLATRELYNSHYSMRRLRDLALKIRGSKHADLWHSLSLVFDALGKHEGCPELALCGLGSFLWRASSTANLLGPHQANGEEPVFITNDDLLQAVRELAYVEQDRVLRTVDYRNLGSEELGSVYESLLELNPVMHAAAKSFELTTVAGNERKLTGSYYTPDSLVQCLLDSALDPVVESRVKEAKELASSQSGVGKKGKRELPDWFRDIPADEQQSLLATGYSLLAERALLALKVCDPACGSGHFLIAAAHRLARHLARIRTGESEPSPEDYQHALRDVIGRCVYGVDLNPMAVELCKVSLWMEAIEPGKPLSFLDHHIQCGNSLLGTTPALLAKGIPDDAFKPIEGDDKAICSELKRDNKKQRKDYETGQGYLFSPLFKLGNLPATMAQLDVAADDSLEDVEAKREIYQRAVKGADYLNARLLADTWCAAFVWKKDNTDLGKHCPTERDFRAIENNPHSILPHVKAEVRRLAEQYQFFHWHLAFPDVFRLPEKGQNSEIEQTGWSGGFDVVLGNPPWETLEFIEKEWFTGVAPQIATAKTSAARQRAISRLAETDPPLFELYLENVRLAEGQRVVVRNTGRYPLCATGKINTYSIFAELNRSLMGVNGRVGCIVPSGIATDNTTRFFFCDLMESRALVSLYAFDNKEHIFPAIKTSLRFCLLTLTNPSDGSRHEPDFVFYARRPQELQHDGRHFTLTAEDLQLLNPNTLTCPIFRTKRDAELTKRIYRRMPVLIREAREDQPEKNPWGITFRQGLFNMSSDSHLFQTRQELEEEGWSLDGNIFRNGTAAYLPLYEAKMVGHYDHRALTYEGTRTRPMSCAQVCDPQAVVFPRYWVSDQEVRERLEDRWDRGWLIGWHDVTDVNTMSRTVHSCILPYAGVGHTMPLVLLEIRSIETAAFVVANMTAFGLDYVARQKIGGTHLTYNYLKQFPFVPPNDYGNRCQWSTTDSIKDWGLCRILELTYTTWELEPFARDCGHDGPPFRWDEERRFLLRCELDAAYFHLYLGPPEEWGTDSSELREMFPTPRDAVEYIMENFPIVKRKDIARTEVKNDAGEVIQEGRYITKDTILEIYDEMAEAIRTGQPYQTRLDPPPGPPTDAEGNFIPMSQWDPDNWPPHIHPPRGTEEDRSRIADVPLHVGAAAKPRVVALPGEKVYRRVTPQRNERYEKCVPLLDLKAAAGQFGEEQGPGFKDWVEINSSRSLVKGMFVAEVIGASMEPLIPDGAYCLFQRKQPRLRSDMAGLFQLHDATDAESGGRFTVKTLQLRSTTGDDGYERSTLLVPENPEFSPIQVTEDNVTFIAEFVEVLRPLDDSGETTP